MTHRLATAPRQYVRARLIEAVEAADGRVEVADLQRRCQQVLSELELPLLEAL